MNKPDIQTVDVGGRWSYIVTIVKRNYDITITGKNTYIDEQSALKYGRRAGTENI